MTDYNAAVHLPCVTQSFGFYYTAISHAFVY